MCLKKNLGCKKNFTTNLYIIYMCIRKLSCYANPYMTSIISVLCYAYTNMTIKILPSAKQNSI